MFLRHNLYGLLWALLILILSGIPGGDIPHVSFLELLNFDKVVHASIFFVLVILLIRGFSLQNTFLLLNKHPKFLSFLVCVVYGGLIEVMQGLIFEQRSADIYDFIADAFGSILGLLLFNKIIAFWNDRIKW